MRTVPLVAGLLLSLAWCFAPCGGSTAQGEQRKYSDLPWHLVDIYWELPRDMPFESYSVDVTLSDDVPSTTNLYIAPIGLGVISGTQFYGGLQTQVDAITKNDKAGRILGRGLIFSMWGERSLDAIRPAEGGFCESSGHEGDFISARRHFPWKKGAYTYRLVRMDKEVMDGKPYTWVGAFVRTHAADENIFVGALRFPGENLTLSKSNLASFVEIYGSSPIGVEEIPKVRVTFGNLQVNGKPVETFAATATYDQDVPDYAQAIANDGAIVVTVGELAKNRTQRQVKLLGQTETGRGPD